jgi:hypothetical protein
MDDEHAKGLLAEERFLRIVEEIRKEGTYGVVACWSAPEHYDGVGFDAVVIVRRADHVQHVKVPVQVKSSKIGRSQHFLKYPEHWRKRVPVAVVNELFSDGEIKSWFTVQLNHVRYNTYDFEELLEPIDKKRERVESARERLDRQQACQ